MVEAREGAREGAATEGATEAVVRVVVRVEVVRVQRISSGQESGQILL